MYKKFLNIIFIAVISAVSNVSFGQTPDTTKKKVFIMDIRAEIDPRMSRYVELALKKAEDIEADYVVVDMDTYGGALNDADNIRSLFMAFDKPTFVFINNNAASAGALISIACDSIYMASGSNIGAATVVTQDGTPAPDKYQSYMRSMMRSTAESSGRDPDIAEGMVGKNVGKDSLSQIIGDVITFTTAEAVKNGYCEGEVSSIEEILELNGIKNYETERYTLSSTEKVISFFLNPYLSSILILILIGGIYFELQTPGVGFPGVAALLAAILYFTPYYLNGLADNWEIVMFIVGIGLIAAEIFVIPGFGVAGILGIITTMTALVLVMIGNDSFDFSYVPGDQIYRAVITMMVGVLGAIVAMIFGGTSLLKSKFFIKRIALETVQDSKEGYVARFNPIDIIGKTGKTYTVLRPGGKVMIDDEIYDAVSRGEYIEADKAIVVINEESSTVIVKELL